MKQTHFSNPSGLDEEEFIKIYLKERSDDKIAQKLLNESKYLNELLNSK